MQAAAIRASQHYPVSAVFRQVLLSLWYLFVNMLPLFFSAVMLSASLADYSQFPWHTDFLLCLPRRCQLFPAWAVATVTCANTFLFGCQTCLGQTEEHFPKGFANTQGELGYRHWLPTGQPHTSFLHIQKHT